jgi:hypothetical protein
MEFLLGTSNLNETWTRDFYLHLVTNSTHDEEFEIQTRNFLTLSRRFKLKIKFEFP